MKYRQIALRLPLSSELAFGCASVMGRISKKQSIRVLHQALDVGVTHFDVARSYGYGEAESCVGEVLRSCREKVVITTKFGILPSRSSSTLKKLKPFLQSAIKILPSSRLIFNKGVKIANTMPISGQFAVHMAKASLEKSLIELKTDYIDILFLHDCTKDDLTEEHIDFLKGQITAGKIRTYGVATSIEAVVAIEKCYGSQFILQFPNSVINHNHKQLVYRRNPFLTYSAFLDARAVMSCISTIRFNLQAIDLSSINQEEVYELMLCYALNTNKNGAVIVSMLSDQHLQTNLRIIEQPRFNPEQVNVFAETVKKVLNSDY